MQIGTILEGRYRLVSEGTPQDLGTEYKAYDLQHDRLMVVLALDPRFRGGQEVLDRLGRVQQAVADLAQPTLIPFRRVGRAAGRLYLARDHEAGRTLADWLAEAGPLRVEVAVETAIRLSETLAAAHRAGLVHGGLSPHSVLVRDDGQVAVTDVGLLPALRPVPAPPGRPWGRFPYLSPEQAAGEEVHPASDVYVIGSLLYEMLTGRPPFHASDEMVLALQHLRQEPPALQVLVPQVPDPLAQIVHKALAKEPAARYRHAGQLAHILRSQVGPPLAPAVPSPTRALVVPPPPAQPAEAAADWVGKPAGVDWILVGLSIAALIAVLGLIPLWRAVYRRYALPPPTPTPIFYQTPLGSRLPLPRGGAGPGFHDDGARPQRCSVARGRGVVWDWSISGLSGIMKCFGFSGLGAQLTGFGDRLYYTWTVKVLSGGGRR